MKTKSFKWFYSLFSTLQFKLPSRLENSWGSGERKAIEITNFQNEKYPEIVFGHQVLPEAVLFIQIGGIDQDPLEAKLEGLSLWNEQKMCCNVLSQDEVINEKENLSK